MSCLRCHKVKGEGGDVGPDLAGIGGKQKRDYLLESIVEPNKQIAQGYETVVLTLTNGKVVSGILKGEDAKEVQLMTAEGQLRDGAEGEDRRAGARQVGDAGRRGQAPVASASCATWSSSSPT